MKSQIEIILEQILDEFERIKSLELEDYFQAVEDCENIVKDYLDRVKTN